MNWRAIQFDLKGLMSLRYDPAEKAYFVWIFSFMWVCYIHSLSFYEHWILWNVKSTLVEWYIFWPQLCHVQSTLSKCPALWKHSMALAFWSPAPSPPRNHMWRVPPQECGENTPSGLKTGSMYSTPLKAWINFEERYLVTLLYGTVRRSYMVSQKITRTTTSFDWRAVYS